MRHLPGFRGMGVSGRDVTPNPVNWTNVGTYLEKGDFGYKYTVQRMQGINQTITLRALYDSSIGDAFYFIGYGNNETTDYTSPFDPVALGFTYLSENGTFTVNPGEWVIFGAEPYDTSGTWLEVQNVSDGNKVLDTFGIDFA